MPDVPSQYAPKRIRGSDSVRGGFWRPSEPWKTSILSVCCIVPNTFSANATPTGFSGGFSGATGNAVQTSSRCPRTTALAMRDLATGSVSWSTPRNDASSRQRTQVLLSFRSASGKRPSAIILRNPPRTQTQFPRECLRCTGTASRLAHLRRAVLVAGFCCGEVENQNGIYRFAVVNTAYFPVFLRIDAQVCHGGRKCIKCYKSRLFWAFRRRALVNSQG